MSLNRRLPKQYLTNGWLSKLDNAIRGEAKLYFRYMDDILRDIKKHHIKTKLEEINLLGAVYMRGGTGRLPGRDSCRDPSLYIIAAERQRGSSLIWTCFTRPSLSRLSIYCRESRFVSVCLIFPGGIFTEGGGAVCMAFACVSSSGELRRKKFRKRFENWKENITNYYMANLHIAGIIVYSSYASELLRSIRNNYKRKKRIEDVLNSASKYAVYISFCQ